jgi:small subunit ribosomal protein S2
VAVAVVCLLEAVEVEENERETPPIAAGSGGLGGQAAVEGLVVQEAGQGVATGTLGELARDARDVGGDATVERVAGVYLVMRIQDAAENEELTGDLAGRKTQALALAGEVLRERGRIVIVSECRDERREAAELTESSETDERGRDALVERSLDALDGEIPRGCFDYPAHGRISVEITSARMQRFCTRPGGLVRVAVPGSPGPTRIRRQYQSKPRRISLPVVTMRELLEAGVHFGHQTRRWNPKMRRYIFTERGGIYIIDLQQTLDLVEQAASFVRNVAERGGSVLFVGTKKQSQDSIAEEATRVGMPYVNHRWLGGLLTNWRTISERLERLQELRRLRDEGQLELLPPKERMTMVSELEKLETNLGGVVGMKRLPDAMFVIDLRKEQLAIREARRLGMPVVGLVDTNCDPDDADFVIPGNDDAIRSCSLIVRAIADSIEAGKSKVTVEEMTPATTTTAAEPAPEEEEAAPETADQVPEEVPAE